MEIYLNDFFRQFVIPIKLNRRILLLVLSPTDRNSGGAVSVPLFWLSLFRKRFPALLEKLQPSEQQRIANLPRLAQLLRRLAPVKAYPAAGMLFGAVDELG